jgi:hypothetical protein
MLGDGIGAFKFGPAFLATILVGRRPFPVTRENTGKFAIFGFEMAKAPRLLDEN